MNGYKQCPKCGGTHVQLTTSENKHGCLWLILLGWLYVMWIIIKICIGLMVLLLFDWWMAIIKHAKHKGYVWKCKRFFSMRRNTYYCNDCGYNFKG